MQAMRRSAVIVAVALTAGCGSSGTDGNRDATASDASAPDGGAVPPAATLAELLRQYEQGAINRSQLTAGLASFEGVSGDLPQMIDQPVLLRARAMPYDLPANTTVGPEGALVVEGGATLVLGKGVTLLVRGNFYVLGAKANRAIVRGPEKGSVYRAISLVGKRSEIVGAAVKWGEILVSASGTKLTPIVIEDSKLDEWRTYAIEAIDADGAVVRGNELGVDNAAADAQSETMHGSESAVLVENNVFGRRAGYNDAFDLMPCTNGHFPVLRGNLFLGGDDDAIDLDNCTALVVGNHFKGFRPGPTAAGQANGGVVTGEGAQSRPLIVNNVFEDCVHAIGFKDGARPTAINNTTVNCQIGVTMYSAAAADAATGIVINNVHAGVETDVILNGSWFAAYNPTKTGALEASHNMFRDPAWAGMNDNLAADPMVMMKDGVPHLGAGSPARGTALADLELLATKTVFPVDVLRKALETDFLGKPRPFANGRFTGMDRGAVQGP